LTRPPTGGTFDRSLPPKGTPSSVRRSSMKRRHIVIAAVSAVLLAVGGAAPAASAHASHNRHHGVEHILALQGSANGPQVVIGNGPIHAQGKDVQISNNRDRFVFPKGSLLIWHKAKTSHQSFDP
jgi:hypothetical protein